MTRYSFEYELMLSPLNRPNLTSTGTWRWIMQWQGEVNADTNHIIMVVLCIIRMAISVNDNETSKITNQHQFYNFVSFADLLQASFLYKIKYKYDI